MKNLWLAVVAVFLFSCGSNKPNPTDHADKSIQAWQGTINGKIPVSLWIKTNHADGMVFGELVYTNTKLKEPIYLIGKLDTSLRLSEYGKDGKSSGLWSGKIKAGKLAGTWSSMSSDKEMPFELFSKDTAISTSDADFTNTENIDGGYSYSYPCQAMGDVNIKKLGNDKVIFNASCVTCAPAFNIAEMNDDTLLLKNNMATYSSQDENGKCSFTIKFYKQFLTISYDCDTCYQCGFGMGASVSGVFIKTSSKPAMGHDIH